MFKLKLLKGITEIDRDIGKLETPHERITTRTYLFMTMALIGVIIIFWNIIRSNQVDAQRECKERDRLSNIKIDRQQIEIDSLILKNIEYRFEGDSIRYRLFEVEKEMYENRVETINQKKVLIKKAKQFLKK